MHKKLLEWLDARLDWLVWVTKGFWPFVVLHDNNVDLYFKKFHDYPGYHSGNGYTVPKWLRWLFIVP